MYKVVKKFKDIQDAYHAYNVGDVFPREGLVVSEKRIAQLMSSQNRQHVPLIVEVEADAKTVSESVEGLNLTAPVQQETAEQEVPPYDIAEADTKPKRGRRSKEA